MLNEDDLTVYAHWEQNSYLVTLDLNDNDLYDKPTLDVNSYSFIYDDEITDSIDVPSYLDGYEFLGWYEDDTLVFNIDGTLNENATSYFLNTKWIKATTVYLKAKWKANGYVVRLNQPLATKKGNESIYINYNATLPNITIPERKYNITYNVNDSEGTTRSSKVDNVVFEWTFDGYYTETNNQYYNGSGETSIIYREARDIDLYERWSNGTITELPEPKRTGYTFDGWYLDDTFENKVEVGYTVTEDIELYAKWTAKKYTITFDNNKASTEGTTSLEVTFDQDIDSIIIPEKVYVVSLDKNYSVENQIETKNAEWEFTGYYTSVNGTGTRYFDAEGNTNIKYTLDEDLQLYASYTGGTIELPEYTRDDYIFTGWYNASDVKAEDTDKYEENTTLFIRWKSEEYNLMLNIGKPEKMTAIPRVTNRDYTMAMHTTDNNVINVPDEVVGWEFLGWFDEDTKVFNELGEWQADATEFFDTEGNWIKKENVTLYGHWSPLTYPLTLNVNAPSSMTDIPDIVPNVYTLVYDSDEIDIVSIPTHALGYSFDGYYLEDELIYNSSGYRVNDTSVFSSTGTLKMAEAIELNAHWSEYPNMLELVINTREEMQEIPRLANPKYEMVKDSKDNNTINIPSTVTGFNFLGWYDGTKKVYDETGSYVESSYFDEEGNWLKDDGARLTSLYEPVKSIITLDINSPIIDEPDLGTNTYIATYAGDEPSVVDVPSLLDQYDFEGWYYEDTQVYDADGNKNISATQFFDTNGNWLYLNDVTLTAKWKVLDIKVTLDINKPEEMENDPEVNNLTYTMTFNSTENNTIDVPTNYPEEYTFEGWYDGDIQVYDSTGTFNSTASSYFDAEGNWIRRSSVTLKAKWTTE